MIRSRASGAPAAHDDGDQRPSVAMDRGQEIEAGRPGVAGLDSVDAVDAAEQMVVIADDLAVIVELGGREIMEVARKPLLERAPEDGEVVRRGQLLVVREAGGVAIERARHAELVRLARHHVGEIVFRLADRLGDRDRHVIRRTGHDRLDRVLDADRVARLKAELRGLLRSGVLGDRDLGSEASSRRDRASRTTGRASSPW